MDSQKPDTDNPAQFQETMKNNEPPRATLKHEKAPIYITPYASLHLFLSGVRYKLNKYY